MWRVHHERSGGYEEAPKSLNDSATYLMQVVLSLTPARSQSSVAPIVGSNRALVRTRREPACLFERCAAARCTTPRYGA